MKLYTDFFYTYKLTRKNPNVLKERSSNQL